MKSIKPTEAIRDRVRARDGHYCARCGRSIMDYPSSIHHRLPRRMGGTRDPRSNDLRNLVRICGTGTTGCHGEIETMRNAAYEEGWLIRSYDDLDTPMSLRAAYPGVLRLYADGSAVVRAAS